MEQKKADPRTHDDLTAYLDPSISPVEDFHAYATRRWCDANPIPAKESTWGAFAVLREDVKKQLHALLLGLVADDALPDGSNTQKIRDFYRAGMNEERIERDRLNTYRVQATLWGIERVESMADIVRMVGRLHLLGMGPLWQPFVSTDAKKSTTDRLQFEQAGLSLPDRDYYLKEDDEKFAKVRAEFMRYMEAMHLLLGDSPEEARDNAVAVFTIENRLARASLPSADRRDEEKQYHPRTLQEISLRENGLGRLWTLYLEAVNVFPEHTPEYIIVRQPLFFEECEKIIREAADDSVARKAVKAYLRWQFVNKIAGLLARDFADLHLDFYEKVLNGAKVEKPRWERVLDAVNGILGFALGELYVERHFPPEANLRVSELVDNLVAVYESRLKKLPWMSEETKARALAKLAVFKRKLGYPDKRRDYSAFMVFADAPYVDTYLHGSIVEFLRRIRKIDQPVDRDEWYMTPHTVNAQCDPQLCEIVFPAGILQPPFFDPRADDAVNYGAIGFVIGHEMTHGFDDEGSKFDEKGNLSEWWKAEDRARFMACAAMLREQYAAHTVCGLPVNGQLTLGENIADLGGLSIAFEAFRRAMERNGCPKDIGGFTPEQRFFLSAARVWRFQAREEKTRQRITADPHAPPHLRINIPCSNMREFHEAFGCKEGCAMYRSESERVEIW